MPRLRDWGVPLGRYVGVDAAPGMLRPAAARLASDAPWPWGLAAGDAGLLPFAPASFDVAVSASTQHDWPDPAAAFAEARRVLRPGGRLVLMDWSADFLSMRILQRWLRLRGDPLRRVDTSADVGSALEEAGFRVAGLRTKRVAPAWGMMVVDALA